MRGKKLKKLIIVIPVLAILLLVFLLWKRNASELPQNTKMGNETLPREICYENCLVLSCRDGKVIFFADNRLWEYPVKSEEILVDILADVWVKDEMVWKISLKTDTVRGKVLAIGDSFIEIEGYGRVPLSKQFHVFELYEEPKQLGREGVLVGYDGQDFIVGNGEICGALLKERLALDYIRVLLMTDGYRDIYHQTITVTAATPFAVREGNEEKVYEAGQILTLTGENVKNGRVSVYSTEEGGKITITSINRAQGNPSYYGKLEIWQEGGGLLCVNELLLEQYLYSVVPSEMPASYGVEALKAQAVCARSYAYRNIISNTLGLYGAHVNDSSQYQVYNNQEEYPASTQAVKETTGQIMKRDGEVVEAYYFSTSCGHTTNADIWGEGISISYIQGREVCEAGGQLAISEEEAFKAFIKSENGTSFDAEFPWYRWEVTFSLSDIQKRIANKGLEKIGTVTGMEVTRRGVGGVAKELTVTGTEGSVVIEKENAIRNFLIPSGLSLNRKDGQVITDFSLLPSGFFTAEAIWENGVLFGYRLYGGGFGHGAGMSQNAVKRMVELGYTYQEVLQFFYQGITMENIVMPWEKTE